MRDAEHPNQRCAVPPRATRTVAQLAYGSRTLHHLLKGFGWRAGVALALSQRRPTKICKVTPLGAPTMLARVGRGESDLATMVHVWLEKCYYLESLTEPRWIIDAGANAGYSTRWLAEMYPSSTVIAIEPDPANFALLRRNVAHLDNVELRQVALSESCGTAELIDEGDGPWAMRVGAARSSNGRVVGEVECVTISSILDWFDIDRVDFLKVDIEGGELEVFRSASGWIDRIEAIAVELHDRFRPGCMRAFIEATVDFGEDFSRGENSFAIRTPTGEGYDQLPGVIR